MPSSSSSPSPAIALPPGTACVECRRRKTRCDGVRPECSRCARLGKQCRYETPDRRPRIDRMEGRVQELEEKLGELIIRRPTLFGHELIQRLQAEGPQATSRTPVLQLSLPFFSEAINTPTVPYTGHGTVIDSALQEGYNNNIPRTLLDAGLQRLHPRAEVTPELSNYLTRVVIPFRGQFHFHVNVHRFVYRLRLPPGHPSAIHPCLLNAVYLAACSLIGGASMATHEQLFLNRARQACEQSLAFADRLIHFMWANVILASYYLRAGRVVEAHSAIGSTVRFAVGAGLHVGQAMETMQTHDVNALSLPPADPIDGEERANLWWALTMCEAAISLGAGLPSSAPVENRASLNSLFFQRVSSPGGYYSEVELKARSSVLLQSTRDFVSATRSRDIRVQPNLQSRYHALVDAHSTMERIMPNLFDPRGLLPSETYSWCNPELVQVHLAWHVSTILLYSVQRGAESGSTSASAKQKMLRSAERIVALALQLRAGGNLMSVHAHLNSIWYCYTACEVLIQEIRDYGTHSPSMNGRVPEQTEQSLSSLFDFLLDLINMYPFWQRSIHKLPQLLEGIAEFDTIN